MDGNKQITLFKDARPDLFALIDRELTNKNEGLTDKQIDSLSDGSNKRLWFRCSEHLTCNEHVWTRSPNDTTHKGRRKFGCPFCDAHSTKHVCICDPRLLKNHQPEIFAQIDHELTKKHEHLTDNEIDRLLFASKKFVYFRCPSHTTCLEHVWRTTISNRTKRSSSCPYCSKSGNAKICECLSLYLMYPAVAANWDYEANEQPGPKEVRPQSHRIAKWKCKICDYRWQMDVNHCVRLVRGCPNCSQLAEESVGAQACRHTLTEMEETFVSQGTVFGLRYTLPLRFDFLLCQSKANQNRYRVAIEFDGEQHFYYKPRAFHGSSSYTIDEFKQAHLRDLIKNRFCGENRIHLLRIAYSIPVNNIGNVIRRFFARTDTATSTQTIIQYVGKEYNEEYFKEW